MTPTFKRGDRVVFNPTKGKYSHIERMMTGRTAIVRDNYFIPTIQFVGPIEGVPGGSFKHFITAALQDDLVLA